MDINSISHEIVDDVRHGDVCFLNPNSYHENHAESYIDWISHLSSELTKHGETDYTSLIRWRLGWHWQHLEEFDRIRASMYAESMWMYAIGSSEFQLLDNYIISMISSRESVLFRALAEAVSMDPIAIGTIDNFARKRTVGTRRSTRWGFFKYRLQVLRLGGRIEYYSSNPAGWRVCDGRGQKMQILASQSNDTLGEASI